MNKYGENIELKRKTQNTEKVPTEKIVNNIEETKSKTDDVIIYSEGKINKVYEIIKKALEDEIESDIEELLDMSREELSEYNRYQILYYLIENGIHFAPIYAKELNLDTSNIHLNLFISGFKNGGDRLFWSENNYLFMNMYKDINEIKSILGKEGFLEQYDYYLLETPSLGKIKKEDTKTAINNYKKIKFTGDTLEKLNSYGLYDWDSIIENIFEDSELAKKIFFELYILNKKEKQHLANLKVDFMDFDFQDDIEMTIEKAEEDDKSLYFSLNFDKYEDIKNQTNLLYSKINEICILKNGSNEFQVTFMDITGKINHIELTSKINKLISYKNSFEDKEKFSYEIKKVFEKYIHFLNINDFNFKVLIFKSNGNKDPNNYESSNNISYTGKQLKIA